MFAHRSWVTSFFVLGVLLMPVFFVQAQINQQITFYGTLRNSSGDNLDGTYDMVFRFYDASVGGTMLATSTHTASNGNPVDVSNGEFSVVLGSGAGNDISGINYDSAAIFVGLSIEDDVEIVPRDRLTAATYAFNSDTLDSYHAPDFLRPAGTSTLSVTSSDTLLVLQQSGTGDILNLYDGGSEVFTVLDGGMVGIGNTASTHDLSVSGDFRLTDAWYDSSNNAGASGQYILSTGTGSDWQDSSALGFSGGSSLFSVTGSTTYLTALTDNLAFGTTSTSQKLAVDGSLGLTDGFGLSIDAQRYFWASSTNEWSSFFGLGAGERSQYLEFTTLIGHNVAQNAVDGYMYSAVAIGSRVLENGCTTWNCDLESSVIIGANAARNIDPSVFQVSTFIGAGVAENAADSHWYSTAIGFQARGSSTESYESAAIGYRAGYGTTWSDFEYLFGAQAGEYSNSIRDNGDTNIAMGALSGHRLSADTSVALGYLAGANFGTSTMTINDGLLLGREAGKNAQQNEVTMIGARAGMNHTNGTDQTYIGADVAYYYNGTQSDVIGAEAFHGTSEFSGSGNVAIGYQTGYNAETGANNNLLIGYRAGDNLTTGSNNIVIGYDSDVLDPAGSNTLNIGNTLFATGFDTTATINGNIGIGTSSPSHQLTTTGGVRFASLGSGTVITDANGVLSVSSDERLKNIQSMYTNGIDSLITIEPIIYKWNDVSGLDTINDYIGFSAQNVQAAIPGAVGEDNRGYLTLSDRGILATVVNSVKEVWGRVDQAEARVSQQEAQVEALEAEIVYKVDLLKQYENNPPTP